MVHEISCLIRFLRWITVATNCTIVKLNYRGKFTLIEIGRLTFTLVDLIFIAETQEGKLIHQATSSNIFRFDVPLIFQSLLIAILKSTQEYVSLREGEAERET